MEKIRIHPQWFHVAGLTAVLLLTLAFWVAVW